MTTAQVQWGNDAKTCRGFEIVHFRDEYGAECSLQISSAAVCANKDGTVDNPQGWIWLGKEDALPVIRKSKARELGIPLPSGDVSGWMPYPVPDDVMMNGRMHLNEQRVRGLIARLQTWLSTGTFR